MVCMERHCADNMNWRTHADPSASNKSLNARFSSRSANSLLSNPLKLKNCTRIQRKEKEGVTLSPILPRFSHGERIMDSDRHCDLRSICTVSQMAQNLAISRARLYQLINEGVFPPPAYCCRSRKPLYPHRLQAACLEIRKTGVGWNGKLVRFCKHRKKPELKPEHKELIAFLRNMGLSVTISQIKKASRQLGLSIAGEQATNAETIRMLFQHLYCKSQKGV